MAPRELSRRPRLQVARCTTDQDTQDIYVSFLQASPYYTLASSGASPPAITITLPLASRRCGVPPFRR